MVFATSTGAPLDWQGVRATAARLGARAVFFVAADINYVKRYATWYARSVLMCAGVPCLVIVHVIGGAPALAALAGELGITDKLLIFAGDHFDAATATARAVDSPLDKVMTLPVAHFQSMRFIVLGALMRQLNLPVLVSDIDTILQRGVADLLSANADMDVVFNQNPQGLSHADHVTANLLLVYPSANAAMFLRFLRSYLERYLRKPEVIRWIDQIGLLLARHYLRSLSGARVGTFQDTDINNWMYAQYAPNPYRFLSLYQGFDMAS